MNFNDLASFVRVVELGTISAAASDEGVPKSTISRRIARLEEQLGVELLRRSARSFTLTEDGRMLHARSAAALHELADLGRELRETGDVPRGRLVVTAPRDVARSDVFAKLLGEYGHRYPEVRVEVRLEARYVDLAREGVDVALRAHEGEIPGDAGLMARSLGSARGRLYAGPAYLERHELPSSPALLCEHELVLHRIHVRRAITLCSAEEGERTIKIASPRFLLDDFSLAQRIVEAGGGIGLLASLSAESSVRAGLLVPVLPEWSTPMGRLSLVWPASRQLAPRVRTFVTLASERLVSLAWIADA